MTDKSFKVKSTFTDEVHAAEVMKTSIRWAHVMHSVWYICITAIICTIILRCT